VFRVFDDLLKTAPQILPFLEQLLPEYRPYHLVFSGFDQQDQLAIRDWLDPQALQDVMSRIHNGFVKCLGDDCKQQRTAQG